MQTDFDSGVEIFGLDDEMYKNIKNAKEYEFSYCLAYEMLTRTKEYRTLIEWEPQTPQDERLIDTSYKLLGLDLDYYQNWLETMEIIQKKTGKSPDDDDFPLLATDYIMPAIKNIEDGLKRVIDFYLLHENIYQPIPGTGEYRVVNDKTASEIFLDHENYYIPITDREKKILHPLDGNFLLRFLDKSFLGSLNPTDYVNVYAEAEPLFSAPALRFYDSKVIKIPINLNLPENELVAYIKKIKQDFDIQNLDVQSPWEALGHKLDKIGKPKSEKILPASFERRKDVLIKALHVHDLNYVFSRSFAFKLKQLKNEKNAAIKELNKDKKLDVDVRERRIHEIKEKYEIDENQYTRSGLMTHIEVLTGIPATVVAQYLTLMKEYIDRLGYRKLITGNVRPPPDSVKYYYST